MHPLLSKLLGGDMRSIGRSPEVAAEVLADPSLLQTLLDGTAHPDPRVRMRAADALEKVSCEIPERLQPFKDRILYEMSESPQQEVRWHTAQLVSRLQLTPAEARHAARFLTGYLSDKSKIVCTFSMQALCELALRHVELQPRVRTLLEECTRTGSPAMRSRGKRLLEWINRADAGR